MSPLKALAAAVLLLVLLFVGPIIYRTGQRVALYLNCPYGDGCRPRRHARRKDAKRMTRREEAGAR